MKNKPSSPDKKNNLSFLEKIFNTPFDYQTEFFVELLDNIHECIAIIDNFGKLIFFNSAYAQAARIPKGKFIGELMEKLEPNARILDVFESGMPVIDDVSHVKALNIDVIANIYPLFHENQKIGAIGIFRNTTEISNLNRQLDHFKLLTIQLEKKLNLQKSWPAPIMKIVGNNYHFNKVLSTAALASTTNVPVLILGESGVGKEVLARAIHKSSNRSNGPFIKINCAAIPDQLFESELFGYEEGAFTGAKRGGKKGKIEMAQGGTMLLDEIGELSLSVQAKLLRVFQEKEIDRIGGKGSTRIDVRFIVATNRDLQLLVNNKMFREDLYFRINLITLLIPPLRERRDDIPAFTKFFLNKYNQLYNKSLICSKEVMDIFFNYHWPGNIREMQNVIEHATIICQDNIILSKHLPANISNDIPTNFYNETLNLKRLINEIEEKTIRSALNKTNNNKSEAIKLLGLSRRAFYQKLSKYKIQYIEL